tara:strand:- start:2625 stop:3140 length:516 start_codon:yes stop_codon:yes gene_type:complete
MEPKEYKEHILEILAHRFEENHNSLPDAYALIWAIDVYAALVSHKINGKDEDIGFKNELEAHCEPFKIIRSASNAIKHIERRNDQCFVKSIDHIQAGKRAGFHAYFSNNGRSEASIAITMSWAYSAKTDAYSDASGKEISPRPESSWKTQYLRTIYRPAIEAIDIKLANSR